MSEVTAYIKAMSAPYETPPQWVAALKDIQNARAMPSGDGVANESKLESL
jgi:hypothetical protein